MTAKFIATGESDFGQIAGAYFRQALLDFAVPNVILPTGDTPGPFYAALRGTPPLRPFAYVQLDEHCGLPRADDPRSFANWLAREVLDPLQISVRQTFNTAALDPAAECRQMADWLDRNRLDIAVVGLGKDGHVGYNLPGSSLSSGTRIVKLSDTVREQADRYWRNAERVNELHSIYTEEVVQRTLQTAIPPDAYTLGIGDLRRAGETIVLVRGAHKAEALRRAFHDEISSAFPATYLQQQRNVTIIADRPALALL